MKLVHKIETWGNSHHPIALDPFRIALGLFLAFKGASFMNDNYALHSLIVNQTTINLSDAVLMNMVYLVAFVHLVGGIMIALGVMTRLAAVVQLPIMLGAVIIERSVNLPTNTELWLSITVLCTLIVFAIVGSGKISIERVLENQNSLA
jgi:putative oxidoreductase